MLLPSGCSSPDVYVRELSAFLTSELFTLVTVRRVNNLLIHRPIADPSSAGRKQAQVHHLDIIPRPNSENGDWEQLPAEWRSWFDSALSPDHLQSMLAGVRLGQECQYFHLICHSSRSLTLCSLLQAKNDRKVSTPSSTPSTD